MTTGNNIKAALSSLRQARWRSMLTVLGIIIGVASVVTTVSIGEGVRRQIERQIITLGSDLITIYPGKTVTRSSDGIVIGVNLMALLGSGSLSEGDYDVIKKTKDVQYAVPFSQVTAIAKNGDHEFARGNIIATTSNLLDVLNHKVDYGEFFVDEDKDKNIAIIGKKVAIDLFQENVPTGKSIQLRGEEFIVGGVLDHFNTSPLTPNTDYNSTIFIPYETGKRITGGQSQIYQVLIKSSSTELTDTTVKNLTANLHRSHGNQDDFTVLKQTEMLLVTNKIIGLMTGLIAGVAAISLIVGGIGIMNIMLLSVTERTREIGVRKAVGATNRQILNHFLTEAAILSLAGGVLGIILSIVSAYLITILSDIQPAITLPIMGIALLVSLVVGIFFGITPAIRAASKDPIDALRYE